MPDYTAQEKEYYKSLFQIADADKDGKVGLADAGFFRKSVLADQLLARIWQTCDNPTKGWLSEEDFYVAMRLIAIAQQGKDVVKEAANTYSGKLPSFPDYPPPGDKGSFSNSLGNLPSANSWVITPPERQRYIEYFKATDSDNDGFVTGVEARTLFSKSGLDNADLAKIWKLSDITGDMKLDVEEFSIAMFLINSKKRGTEIPNSLPPSLLPQSSSGPGTPASSSPVPTPKATDSKYTLPPDDKRKYQEIFKRSGAVDGFITGDQAKALFSKSGLPFSDLGKIWMLSDTDKDGRLSEAEFVISMYLIYGRRAGMELPEVLPESIKVDAGLIAATPAAPVEPAKPKKGNYDINLDEIVGSTPSSANNSSVSLPSMPSSRGGSSEPVPSLIAAASALHPSPRSQETSLVVHGTNLDSGFGSSDFSSFGASFPSSFGSAPGGPATSGVSSFGGATTPQQPLSANSSLKNLPSATIAPGRRDEVLKAYSDERASNAELEREVSTAEAELNTATAELRDIELKVSEEKARSTALKEKLKYIKLQLNAVKEQKEQFERIYRDKQEQYQEEDELFQLMMSELEEKKKEITQLQDDIGRISSGTESMRAKRKEAREQMSALKSRMEELSVTKKQLNESVTPTTSTPATSTPATPLSTSPVLSKKEAPPIPVKKEAPVTAPAVSSEGFGNSPFGATNDFGFGSSTFGAEAKDSFGSGAFDSFGSDPFKSGFGTTPASTTSTTSSPSAAKPALPPKSTKPQLSTKKPEDDPFSFSSDLSSESFVDSQKDAFGSALGGATTGAPAPSPFGGSGFGNDFGFGGGFGSGSGGSGGGFGDDVFGSSAFGSSAPPPLPGKKPQEAKSDTGFDPTAFSFPSNVAEFDTGKDSFG